MALFLDTETTGFSRGFGDTVIEVAIVDGDGRTLLDTLIDPELFIPRQITALTGIDDDMVHGKPTFKEVWPEIRKIVSGERVVIYNAKFDCQFFPRRLGQAKAVACAMGRFQQFLGGRSRNLEFAAKYVRHRWHGKPHRALADALACRSVWIWLEKNR